MHAHPDAEISKHHTQDRRALRNRKEKVARKALVFCGAERGHESDSRTTHQDSVGAVGGKIQPATLHQDRVFRSILSDVIIKHDSKMPAAPSIACVPAETAMAATAPYTRTPLCRTNLGSGVRRVPPRLYVMVL